MNSIFNKAILLALNLIPATLLAQVKEDSISTRSLDSVTVIGLMQLSLQSLPATQGAYIFSGKRTEVIGLAQTDADITNKTGRQLFAKVPGIFVYDMDGAGNQVNIAARGLDPHRGWEFNIRKDGIITNSDMYGYPASHFSMPMESIDRIELVRGTGSLQYGAQFGGMVNYVSKQGDSSKSFGFESINTIGSYNLLSSYNAVGGKIGKLRYYAYVSKKSRNGYRSNEHTDSEAESVALTYDASKDISIRLEWSRSKYTYRIPGPLTDNMFSDNPRQATRARNYFSPDIHVPSVVVKWQVSPQTLLQFTSSAVLGERNSVQYDKPVNIKDTINTSTLQYNNRQVDIDNFNSYTNELRLLQQYTLGNRTSTLVAGVQYMNNDLHRRQLGKGTTGSDFDLTLMKPGFGRDMHFKTKNIALFAENSFQLLDNLSANIGVRTEIGQTDLSGKISYYPDGQVPVTIKHNYPLWGGGLSWKPVAGAEIYAGWSQAYHPMVLKDLFPASLYEKVDPKIKDAKGYNAEVGVRGKWNWLRWDITAFLLEYNNRFGTLAQTDGAGNLITYRTNIGNSLTKGLEIFLQGNWLLDHHTSITIFTSTAFTHARYTDAVVKSGNINVNVEGNKVESAPDLITRNGLTMRRNKLSISLLYSYTSSSFSDPLNTVQPPAATGAVGLVPSYSIMDINSTFRINKNLELRVNVNNVTNKQYFTKRPTLYPGPGVWPSEGRNFNTSLIIRL